MKSKLLIVCTAAAAAALMFTACAGTGHHENTVMNEPSGAGTNETMLPTTPGRDINQRPYPGVDPTFDEQLETSAQGPTGMQAPGDELERQELDK